VRLALIECGALAPQLAIEFIEGSISRILNRRCRHVFSSSPVLIAF